ncbi:MAG: hypothetical protein CL816_00505 [Coxiellaceae bacterium]|nr:hypothetical protein [Coxiellaceae bacterium]
MMAKGNNKVSKTVPIKSTSNRGSSDQQLFAKIQLVLNESTESLPNKQFRSDSCLKILSNLNTRLENKNSSSHHYDRTVFRKLSRARPGFSKYVNSLVQQEGKMEQNPEPSKDAIQTPLRSGR